jgi:GNAT superfamily N-acetyltransferase
MTGTISDRTASVIVRPLSELDDVELRRLFRETMVMGLPLPFPLADGGRYESLCLDWYLGPGRRDAAVADVDGRIVGFALVCTDPSAYRRWVRTRAARYALYSLLTLVRTDPRAPVARFHRCRLRDGWVMVRNPTPRFSAHAHMNVLPHELARWAGGSLLNFVDERCHASGLSGWSGEINAVAGKRAKALERIVGPVVHRAPNHTLSWLMGRPVERLTVTRTFPQVSGGT